MFAFKKSFLSVLSWKTKADANNKYRNCIENGNHENGSKKVYSLQYGIIAKLIEIFHVKRDFWFSEKSIFASNERLIYTENVRKTECVESKRQYAAFNNESMVSNLWPSYIGAIALSRPISRFGFIANVSWQLRAAWRCEKNIDKPVQPPVEHEKCEISCSIVFN